MDALIVALAAQGAVTTLASPHIVAMNNEPAIVRVGKELVYFESTPADGAKRTMSPASVLDGLTLTVLAQVSADDFVQLHVPSHTRRKRVCPKTAMESRCRC